MYGLSSSRNNDPLVPPVPLRSSQNQDYMHVQLRSNQNQDHHQLIHNQNQIHVRSSSQVPLTSYGDPLIYTPEQEVSRLRGRVSDLEAENNSLKEEVYRNRQYMEKDRCSFA